MRMRGIEATDTTYTALISAYAKAERLEDALATYKIMASTASLVLFVCMCIFVCARRIELDNEHACHTATAIVSGIVCAYETVS